MKHTLRKNARVASFLRQALKPVFAACVIAPLCGSPQALAVGASLYWDGQTTPNGVGNGGAGNWDTSVPGNTVWTTSNTDSVGTAHTIWINNRPAIFGVDGGAAGGTITINNPVTPTSITFAQSGYDIEDGGGSLNFGFGNTTITVNAGVSATLGSVLNDLTNGDSLTFTTTGAGGSTLFLSGFNTGGVYVGRTITLDGASSTNRLTVQITNTSGSFNGTQSIPDTSDLIIQNNATLDLNGFTQSAGIASLAGNSTAVVTNTSATYAQLILGTSATGSLLGAPTTYAGAIRDTAATVETTPNPTPAGGLGLKITSNATFGYTLILSGTANTNTYHGMTIIAGPLGNTATLQGGATNSFSANSAVDVQAGGILDIHGFDETVAALDGTGTGTITNLATSTSKTLTIGNGSLTGTLTSNANINDGAGNGRIGLTKLGTYTQVLAGNNGYSGATTVTVGTLAAGATTAFSSKSAYTVTSTLDLNGYNSSIGSLAGSGLVINGSGTVTGPHAGAATLLTGLDNTSTTYSGAINDGLSGTLALTKSGNGTFTVSGNSTYSNGTMLLSGGLYADPASPNNSALTPLGTGTVTIKSVSNPIVPTVLGTHTGATLANAISVLSDFSVASGAPSTQDLVLAGPTDLNGATRTITGITGMGRVHFTGAIGSSTGTGGVSFIGTAPYTAFIYDGTAANTYTGVTIVGQNAFLVLQKMNVDGAVIGDVLVIGNGSVDYLGASNQIANTSNVTVNSAGLDAGGKHFQGLELRNNSDTIGNLFGSGTVGLGSGTLTVNGGNFSGNILDGQFGAGGNLTKIGPGALVLGGVNTYTGRTTVIGGTLLAGSTTGFSQASAFTVSAPAVLDVNGFNTSIGSLAGDGTVTNNNGTPGSLTTGFDNTSTSFTGSLQNGVGRLSLGKVGSGTFTIFNSTYSGTTTVSGGTLRAGSGNAFSQQSAFTVNAPGVADLNGFNNTIGSLAGSGTFTNNGAAPAVLTTGQNGTSTAFTGTLRDGNSVFGLTKIGGGTFTVSNSLYSGATNVPQGTLRAGSTKGFSPNSPYTVGGGGILDLNGFNNNIGSLAGDGTVTNNGGKAAVLTTGFDSTSTAFTGSLEDGSAALGLTKTGLGTFTISNSSYSGVTNIVQGTLRAGSTSGFSPNSAFTVTAPGIADINGFNNSIGSLAGTGTVTNNGKSRATLTTGLDNTDTTFSGSLQDGKSKLAITKTGTGVMTLASANTFSGGTVLNGGALAIANSLALGRGNVSVTGGTLQSSGPNNLIQVGGNYSQSGNGELALRIGGASPGNFDRLAVVGKATLGGRLTVTATNGFAPKPGSPGITIITAGGGVTGTFASVKGTLTTTPLVTVTADYFPNSVVLDFGQGSFIAAFAAFSDFALTPNQRAVAFALDNLETNGRSSRLLSFLDAQRFDKLPGAFDRIAPEEYGTIYEISRSAAKMTAVSVENRLDQIHASAAPQEPIHPSSQGPGATGPAGPSDGKGSKEILPPADYRLGVFANGSGEFVSVGNSSNAAGYNFDSGGVTIGVDYKFTDHFVAGVLFNYTRSRADLTEGGRLDVDAFRGGAYASLFGGGAYVNAYLGGGYNDYDMRRTGLDSTVRGETNGGEFNALIATGYDAHAGNFTFGPVASFQYVYTGLSSLDESGSLAPLHINSGKGDSLRTNIGARATYDWHIGSYILTPEVRATYQHEYGDTFEQTTASFLARSPNFTVTNSPIGRDSLILNAGFTLTISPQLAAYAFYDGELARSNYQANNFLVGVRASF